MLTYSIEALYEMLFNQKEEPADAVVRIAVPFDGEDIFPHFGKATHFRLFDIEKGKVVVRTTINTNELSRGTLPEVLEDGKVNAVICGGIGDKMVKLFAEKKMMVFAGVKGNVEQAVEQLLAGKLSYNEDQGCEHRDAHREEAGRQCMFEEK